MRDQPKLSIARVYLDSGVAEMLILDEKLICVQQISLYIKRETVSTCANGCDSDMQTVLDISLGANSTSERFFTMNLAFSSSWNFEDRC